MHVNCGRAVDHAIYFTTHRCKDWKSGETRRLHPLETLTEIRVYYKAGARDLHNFRHDQCEAILGDHPFADSSDCREGFVGSDGVFRKINLGKEGLANPWWLIPVCLVGGGLGLGFVVICAYIIFTKYGLRCCRRRRPGNLMIERAPQPVMMYAVGLDELNGLTEEEIEQYYEDIINELL